MARSNPPAPPGSQGGQAIRVEAVVANVLERGMTLHRQGRLPEARAVYEQILAVHAQHFDALHLLGMLHCQSGNPALAVRWFEQAIAINPDAAPPYNNLGVALQDLGRPQEALACYARLIALDPRDALAHFNQGVVLKKLRRFDEALASYGRAIAITPDYAEAWNNLGVVQKELRRFDEALASHERAIALKPNTPKAHNNRGIALQELKRFDEALVSYDRAIALDANYADAWFNRGVVLQELQQVEQALQSYDKSIALNPRNTDAWFNRGVALHALGRLDEALESYDQTIALDPDYVDVYWNQALALLLGGQFQKGWALYEWRWKNPKSGLQLRPFAQPMWLGAEPLAGKTILLHAEQGLGDIIQFCRYARAVSDLGARVVLDVPAVLAGVLQTLSGVSTLVRDGQDLPPFDCHCPLLSLPLALKTELHTIPTPGPYLASDTDKRKTWGARLGNTTRPRVGLVWSGSTGHKGDHRRSLTLNTLLQYLPPGCDYISLQKEVRAVDLDSLARSDIRHFGDQLHDFADTAALCDLMDLVISVDTSVAHMAGALGKTTWILLPWVPDWRWLLNRNDSPWYASVTLYRQTPEQHWGTVLERLAGDMVQRLGLDPGTIPTAPALARPASNMVHAMHDKLSMWVDQALALHRQGQLAPARALYEQVLQHDAHHFDAQHLLGVLHFQAKSPALAVDCLTQAIALSPQDPAPRNNLGVALNELGRYDEALASYDTVLSIDANHVEAHYNRGVTLKKLGQPGQAVASYDKALAIQPHYAQAHNSKGVVLKELGRLEEALTSHSQAIALKPDLVTAWNNQGIVLQALQRLDEALASYARAIALQPDYAEAWFNQGVALQALNRPGEALASYERALSIQPDQVLAHNNRGVVLQELQRHAEALTSFDRVIALKPDWAQAHLNRSIAQKELGHLAAALDSCGDALRLEPGLVPALNIQGIILHAQQRWMDAIACYDQILSTQPDHAEAHNNRGATLLDLDRPEEAAASFRRAIAASPDYAHAHFNLSIAWKELGQLDASIASCEAATRIKPDYAEAWLNHALALLVTGQFARGWELYEWRWKNAKSGLHRRPFSQPVWLGTGSLAGKTILLHAEQGLGDTIQFCRYAPLVSALGARVVLSVPAALYGLLKPLAGVHTLVEDGMPLPTFDCHCPLLSLPLALGTTLDNIPGTTPYLYSQADQRQAWSARLGAKVRPRVGLVWSGSTIHKNDQQRSLSLERLLPHLPAGLEYISLQKEVRAADQAALETSGIRHFGDQLQDFTDTAALCDLVDLVISVDTSVAHLAAAMGRPTWILLPWVPDWRWLMNRSDSPWYASVTLYRQDQDRQWDPVLRRLAGDLLQHLAIPDTKSGPPPP